MAQLAEWQAVVTCGRTVEEACTMQVGAGRGTIASYRDEGCEPPIGGRRPACRPVIPSSGRQWISQRHHTAIEDCPGSTGGGE